MRDGRTNAPLRCLLAAPGCRPEQRPAGRVAQARCTPGRPGCVAAVPADWGVGWLCARSARRRRLRLWVSPLQATACSLLPPAALRTRPHKHLLSSLAASLARAARPQVWWRAWSRTRRISCSWAAVHPAAARKTFARCVSRHLRPYTTAYCDLLACIFFSLAGGSPWMSAADWPALLEWRSSSRSTDTWRRCS